MKTNTGRVGKHDNWCPSNTAFAVAPGVKRQPSSKLGNKKCALYASFCALYTPLAVDHIGLGEFAKDQTPDEMRYDYPGGAIGFIEGLDLDECYHRRRMMHWTVELQRIRKAARARGGDASKVRGAAPAPTPALSFMELALRPKGLALRPKSPKSSKSPKSPESPKSLKSAQSSNWLRLL
jgi:hypothetical protein